MKTEKRQKRESLILGKLLQRIAPRIGAQVILEPDWGIAGQIIFSNGRISYFRYNTLDVNPVGSADIAKDKDYANFFISRWGFPTVPHSKTFFSDDWSRKIGVADRGIIAALDYAQQIGFPVIVKPNSGSQGNNVHVATNLAELQSALTIIFAKERVALLQQKLSGNDYRLVVLGDKVISAYQRIPLSVTGDGRSTIAELLARKQAQFDQDQRDYADIFADPRIDTKLSRQELTRTSIPAAGQQLYLLDNANLSTGGTSVDITNAVHPEFRRLAIDLTHKMGLHLCGVDFMIRGDITDAPVDGSWWVLEINAAPGLDHYAKTGSNQAAIVEQLYLQVLEEIEHQSF